jgi:alkanesulfonate monooxygenase
MSEPKPPVDVRSLACDAVEVAWFSALCDDDFAFMGVKDPSLKSTWEHCSGITRTADRLGYDNVLCPSGFVVGQDTWTFASAVAPLLERMSLLVAVRCGEVHPGVLARAVATLDHILKGRLTINIISSPLPGEEGADSRARYQRSREVIEILKQGWTRDAVDYAGEFYKMKLPAAPVKPYQQNGGPLLYFGGYSPDAVELCAEHCDVYLMWPETEPRLAEMMTAVGTAAKRFGRTLDYGLRVHVIVRETEAEARDYARGLVSQLDPETGRRSATARSTAPATASRARPRCATPPTTRATSSPTSGPASAGPAPAAAGPSSATPTRSLPSSTATSTWASARSSSRATRTSRSASCSRSTVLPRLKTGKLAAYQNRIPATIPPTPLGAGPRL